MSVIEYQNQLHQNPQIEKLQQWIKSLEQQQFGNDRKQREELFHLLKQLRNKYAIARNQDMFAIVNLLMGQFHPNDDSYALREVTYPFLLSLLRRLRSGLLQGADLQEELAVAVARPLEKPSKKLVVVTIGALSDESRAALAQLTAQMPEADIRNEPEDVVQQLFQAMLMECTIVIFLFPHPSTAQQTARVKMNPWLNGTIIIGFADLHNHEQWLSLTRQHADFILPCNASAELVFAAIEQQFNRKVHAASGTIAEERRCLVHALQKLRILFVRFNTPYTLLFVRLEQFHYIVQMFGAAEVFTYLNALFQSCKKTVRSYDELHRWSLDAFVLLLPMSNLAGAEMVLDRIIRGAAEISQQEQMVQYLSVGVMQGEHGFEGAEEMLLYAQEQLEKRPNKLERIYRIRSRQLTSRIKDRIRVLVVDDDLITPVILANHLSPDEWEVEICTDGTVALSKLVIFKPDIIISETSLSGMNGYAFCLESRQLLGPARTAFIFLTAQHAISNRLRGMQMGADDFLAKPFSAAEVEAKMRRLYLNRKQSV